MFTLVQVNCGALHERIKWSNPEMRYITKAVLLLLLLLFIIIIFKCKHIF